MLKQKKCLNIVRSSLITVQDNTMLKPTVGGGDDKKSLITVQDNTMLKLKPEAWELLCLFNYRSG